MREPTFKLESELCESFIEAATLQGWRCYPETAGFDILAVNAAGHQCGIEAKLKLNLKVIQQIQPYCFSKSDGPHHRVILVPDACPEGALEILLQHAGFEIVFYIDWAKKFSGGMFSSAPMFDFNPINLCSIPEYMPDVPAGVSAPLQLTEWKIRALRVLAKLECDRVITREDFRNIGIDMRRWISADQWLIPNGNGLWVRGVQCPKFDQQHPTVYAVILQEFMSSKNAIRNDP